jgi:hypothetical protein
VKILRGMTPEQRLRKAFELTEMSRALFATGLRARFPDLTQEEFHSHNRNYWRNSPYVSKTMVSPT